MARARTMKAVILAPFRPGPERSRNWKIAQSFWSRLGLPIYTADTWHKEPFERSIARNRAAELAGSWDVALFTDADVFLADPSYAEAAIMRTYTTGAYTVAYTSLCYIREERVDAVRKEVTHGNCPSYLDWDESVALTWECCFAVRRDTWDQVGGFDERFRGYGGQVAAFFYAYATFGGRERIPGTAYHLPHELVDRKADPNFKANTKLADRYRAAVDDVDAMRQILGERR